MIVIRTLPHPVIKDEVVTEVFDAHFCERMGWVAETEHVLIQTNEKVYIFDDNMVVDVNWLVRDGVPVPMTDEETSRVERHAEILIKLSELDLKSIRSIRAIESGEGAEQDSNMLQEIEIKAKALRDELAELTKPLVLTRRARTRKVETEPEADIAEKK